MRRREMAARVELVHLDDVRRRPVERTRFGYRRERGHDIRSNLLSRAFCRHSFFSKCPIRVSIHRLRELAFERVHRTLDGGLH